MQKTKEFYESSEGYDKELALRNTAAKYCASSASQEAYIYVNGLIEEGKSIYDPLSSNDNPIGSLYNGGETIRGAVDNYVKGTTNTWAEAIASLVPTLEEAMRKAFS